NPVSSLNEGSVTSLFQTAILASNTKRPLRIYLEDESMRRFFNFPTLSRGELTYMDWVNERLARFSDPNFDIDKDKRKRALKNLQYVKEKLTELGAECAYYVCD
ncbi:MAG: hypothetical protein AAFY24_26340, partial [Pseudomonadota bacterium]